MKFTPSRQKAVSLLKRQGFPDHSRFEGRKHAGRVGREAEKRRGAEKTTLFLQSSLECQPVCTHLSLSLPRSPPFPNPFMSSLPGQPHPLIAEPEQNQLEGWGGGAFTKCVKVTVTNALFSPQSGQQIWKSAAAVLSGWAKPRVELSMSRVPFPSPRAASHTYRFFRFSSPLPSHANWECLKRIYWGVGGFSSPLLIHAHPPHIGEWYVIKFSVSHTLGK